MLSKDIKQPNNLLCRDIGKVFFTCQKCSNSFRKIFWEKQTHVRIGKRRQRSIWISWQTRLYIAPHVTTRIMSATNSENANVHIIVHGRMALFEKVKDLLGKKGFDIQKMKLASLEEAGKTGEYVAMLWPPWI